jgi:ribosomal protein S18 acetylase RimI-like enzyme
MSVFAHRPLDDTPAHRRDVGYVMRSSEDYFQLTEGGPPQGDPVDDFFSGLPPGREMKDKFTLGFYVDSQLTGVADVVRGWNAAHKAIIGLLLFAPAFRGRGHGRRAVVLIEELAATWPGIDTMRIAVVEGNVPAFSFWQRMGFVETGERRPRDGRFVGDRIVMEKILNTRERA